MVVQGRRPDLAFFCDRLPPEFWDKTEGGFPRKGTYEDAWPVHYMLKLVYLERGVRVVDVPYDGMSPSERVDFIESHLEHFLLQ